VIADFSNAERSLVQVTLKERFRREVEIDEVETELRLNPADRELSLCPALYWEVDGCRFILSKTGMNRFRAMFFWSVRDRFATGKEEYDNLGDCVVTLLKMQEEADAARKSMPENFSPEGVEFAGDDATVAYGDGFGIQH
jgi:hypothetical protein